MVCSIQDLSCVLFTSTGDVYCSCGDGVEAWNPASTLIGRIMVEDGVARFCFGIDGEILLCNEQRSGGCSWRGVQMNIINPKYQVTNITTTTLINPHLIMISCPLKSNQVPRDKLS